VKDYPKIPVGLIICPYCIEDGEGACVRCNSCDAYFPETQGAEVEEGIICPDCKNDNTIICSKCGIIAIEKRLTDNRQIPGLCENCETKQLYCDYILGKKLDSTKLFELTFSQLQVMNTVNLMSRLRHSYGDAPDDLNNAPFDTLIVRMRTFYRRRILDYGFSLVIVYNLPSRFYNLVNYSCTMTEFKKSKISLWNTINKERGQEQTLWSNGSTFHRWNHPYNLRAQTISDMDYRKEFNHGELVYEGNNYGDTSNFYIVGSISNEKSE
jgi:hypothetical protein